LKRNNPYQQRMPPPESKPYQAQTYEYDSLNELEQDDDRPYAIPTKPHPSPLKPMSKAKKRVY
jgi:hypothetical protein